MFKLMGKDIYAILDAQTIPIWTYVITSKRIAWKLVITEYQTSVVHSTHKSCKIAHHVTSCIDIPMLESHIRQKIRESL